MRGSSSELLLDASGQSHRTTTTGTLTATTTIHNLYSGLNHHSQSSGGIYDKQEQSELRRRKLLELGFGASRRQPPRRTCRQRFNFYATSALALVATSGGAALLFLVPLYVDPAISTLAADFSPHPVLCTTLKREEILGIFNCTWSSCREGCTSDVYRCTHIYVTYSPELNFTNASLWSEDIYDGLPEVEAVLKVNIKGCGYPPVVDCDNFTRELGYEGARFPCHYSRVNGSIVMANYNREAQLEIIIHFFAAPFVVTLATSVALCVMHCDCRCVAPSPRHARGMRKIRTNNLSDQSISNRVDRRGHHAHCDCGEVTRPL
ncbi:protein tipE [Cotesia glomerata]|uniref:protein tipE n=1 Tax=Cotesia glomerata TaxID=32391 RepID=UPI001D003244|nr:protein tipE [Cotesia glomerata]